MSQHCHILRFSKCEGSYLLLLATNLHTRTHTHTLVEAKQIMCPSQIQPVDFLVCDVGRNGENIQCVESIKKRMIHGTMLRGDEETGKAVRCVPMDIMVTIRKAIS